MIASCCPDSLPADTVLPAPEGSKCPNEGAAPAAPSTAPVTEIDYADPVAVLDLICKAHPFGELLLFAGIVEACRLGRGRELVSLSTPSNLVEPETVPLAECIDPPVDWIMSFENLERRAFVIIATRFYGIDERDKAAILSVKDAGVVGLLAQANLQPLVKKRRCKSDTRRYGPPPERIPTPNLFKAFGD